jgi:putative hydrolases of HD superfamily
MVSLAFEYERAHSVQLQAFFDSSLPHIRHPEVKEWGEYLARDRDQGLTPENEVCAADNFFGGFE